MSCISISFADLEQVFTWMVPAMIFAVPVSLILYDLALRVLRFGADWLGLINNGQK